MTRTKEDQMIHVDTVKKVALLVALLFFSWNWAAAENEVQNLIEVGTSIGGGWSQCMTELEPKVEELEEFAAELAGLARTGEEPQVTDDLQAGNDG